MVDDETTGLRDRDKAGPAPDQYLRLRAVAATMVVAVFGGCVFAGLSVPAAWLSGPALSVAVAALCGMRVEVPSLLKMLALLLLGAMMGASVTPDTIVQLARTPLTIAGLVICVVVVMGSITLYLRFVHGFDRLSAGLAAAPGASLYVIALAIETRADVKRVAIIQMLRLVALIMLLPSVFAMLGFVGSVSSSPLAMRPVSWVELSVLVLAATSVGLLLEWWRVPTGIMFGAIIAGGGLFGTGTLTTGVPEWIMVPGFVVIGAVVGHNFKGISRMELARTLVAGVGTVVVGSLASLAVALPFSMIAGLPLAQLWLAYAPGGVDTMAIVALAIGLEPAFVAAHHLARFFGLSLILPFLFRGALQAAREGTGTVR